MVFSSICMEVSNLYGRRAIFLAYCDLIRVRLAQLFWGIEATLNLKLKIWVLEIKLKLFGKCCFLFENLFYVQMFDNIII